MPARLSSGLSRRCFLVRGTRGLAGLGVLGLVTACSKAAGPGPGGPPAAAPTAASGAAATAAPAAGGAAGTVTLRFGNTAVQGTTLYDASQQFVQTVADKTSGSLKIDYLSGGVLGGDAQVVEQIVAGTADLNVTDLGLFANYEPKLSALTMPFLYGSLDQAWKVLDGQVGQELAGLLSAKGIRALAYWENGFRNVTNSKHQIHTAEDVKGLKLRVPQIKALTQLFQTLGANPTPMDLGQVYLALQQKVVDGQENPLEIIFNNKFFEVQQYLALTRHVYSPTIFVLSEKSVAKLSPDQLKALTDAAKEIAPVHRQKTQQHEQELLTQFKQHLEVDEQPDLASFREAVKSMRSWEDDQYGADLVQRVMDAAAKAA
jgi:tripartite ATP-independent transporter DctP family solute receptor